MHRRSSRKARRMMDQLGMSIDEVSNVEQVSIRTLTREIVIDGPEVTLTRMQGQRIYQVVGGTISEKQRGDAKIEVPEEDVALVAQQAKVSMEKARETLQQTEGDLAQAILILSHVST